MKPSAPAPASAQDTTGASIDRRAFIKTAALAGAGLALGSTVARAAKNKDQAKTAAVRPTSETSPVIDVVPITNATPAPAGAPNILMIAIDDLRDWANYLGHPQAKTPNLDRLAAKGVAFMRSYCTAPLCNPSRAALLSGMRPSTTGVYNNDIDWRRSNRITSTLPNIPLWLRQHGYTAHASGKITHESMTRQSDWDSYNQPKNPKGLPSLSKDKGVKQIVFRPSTVDDSEMADYKSVSWCIDKLRRKYDKPLFLGCGFHKPHLAWEVPQKYFDMYPLDKIELPKVQPTLDGLPPTARRWADHDGIHAAMLKSGRWKEALQAYLACISFLDAQIGRLLDALEASACKDNTLILLWSDHGWHHGEKHHWRKSTLWEEATRTHLLWTAPGVTKPGGACHRPVDNSCVFPTLCDLVGIPAPAHLEGVSIRALLENPAAAWDRPAVSTFEYNNHAARTEKWRYIRYDDGGEELYDHETDPLEWTNLAKNPQHASVKTELAKWFPKNNVPFVTDVGPDSHKEKKKAEKGGDGDTGDDE